MLTYDLSEAAGPIYKHLYRKIREDIASGVIPPNSRLPSKRALARNYGISIVTVETAYELLMSEGYIRAVPLFPARCRRRLSVLPRWPGPFHPRLRQR